MGLAVSLGAVYLSAALAPWLHGRFRRRAPWLLAAVPAALFAWLLTVAPRAGSGGVAVFVDWVPSLGVRAAFVLDGLSLLFALLITGIGALVLVYAGAYLGDHPQRGRFFGLLLAFMGSMLGLVWADDLITLFVFWELTSIASYLLIGFDHERPKARAAALQALLVTGGGGLALLVGLLLLGAAGGTYGLSELVAQGSAVRAHALYPAVLVLVLVGAFTKSAQWPFHFWLPNAMAAPTPVSAYLHSATMVKAGVYLLARLDPVLGGTDLWVWLVTPVGAVTMLVGATLALRETDLKRVLAYSTLTALGTLVALLGLSFPDAVKAAVVFLIVHSLYKAALFLVAGTVDHETGTRNVLALSGLRAYMPVTAVAAFLSGLSMAGLPPLFGFVAKELTYKAKLGFAGGEILLPLVAVAANAATVAAAGVVALRPFSGRASSAATRCHEAPLPLLLGPVVLGVAGLVLGLAPTLAGDLVVRPAVEAVSGATVEVKLALWYGWNTALLLSIGTLALGVALHLGWPRFQPLLDRAARGVPVSPEAGYRASLRALTWLAEWQTRLLMRGGTRKYLVVAFGTAAILLWLGLGPSLSPGAFPVPRVAWVAWPLAGVVVAEGASAMISGSRVAAASALGAMGFGVALLFLLAGAPDLALTQLLVETLIVVVVVLVLRRVPAAAVAPSSLWRRATAGTIAVTLGAGFTVLLLAVLEQPFDGSVSEYFARVAVPEAKGRNLVNVILVDFRALDTLGEVAVLGIVGLAVLALGGRNPSGGTPSAADGSRGSQAGGDGASPVLTASVRLLAPLLLVFALVLLWRGHNDPGGGFAAGLVAAAALAARIQATGVTAARAFLRFQPTTYIAVGLGAALVSGLPALAVGSSFMTGLWLELPVGAAVLKLGTPLLFDVGVAAVVLGFGASILLSLETADG